MNIELPAATRHRRDMTEKLLKATLNPNTHTHIVAYIFEQRRVSCSISEALFQIYALLWCFLKSLLWCVFLYYTIANELIRELLVITLNFLSTRFVPKVRGLPSKLSFPLSD